MRNGWGLVALIALVVLAGGGGTYVMLKDTRGFRNNNPGNLRYNSAFQWQGQIGQDPEGYLIFDTMENGVRAMTKVLRTYFRTGFDTINSIVDRYSPASAGNPVAAYKGFLAAKLGVSASDVLSEGHIPALVPAIVEFENGGGLSAKVLAEGIRLAYIG